MNPAGLAEALRADKAVALRLFPVSRETIERLDALVARLLEGQQRMNLVAPSTLPAVWTRHIADSLQLLSLAPHARIWVDLGSGAGFPGLVIAAALNAHVTLVESRRKRASFLETAAMEMGLRNVRVEAGRAESMAVGNGFDLVTERAVGNPAELFKIAGRLLHLGGLLMLYASGAQRFKQDDARAAGLIDETVLTYDLRHGKAESNRAAVIWTRR